MTATEVARYIRGATPVVVAERLNRLANTGVITKVVTPRGATRYSWTPATDEW